MEDTTRTISAASMVKVAVHPLAIVNMSDQYTRVSLGGSPLLSVGNDNLSQNSITNNTKVADMTGLLFGSYLSTKVPTGVNSTNTNTLKNTTNEMNEAAATPLSVDEERVELTVTVSDAKDVRKDDLVVSVPTPTAGDNQNQQQHGEDQSSVVVALHQAVYPMQVVVGWYRVVSSSPLNSNTINDGPTIEDLQLTQQLYHYHRRTTTTTTKETYQSNTTNEPFLFGLLQVTEPSISRTNAVDEDNDDESLPLTLYRLVFLENDQGDQHGSTNGVLVSIDDANWNLETSVAERIAIERAIRDQPPIANPSRVTTIGNAEKLLSGTTIDDGCKMEIDHRHKQEVNNNKNDNNTTNDNDTNVTYEDKWYKEERSKSIYLLKTDQIQDSIRAVQTRIDAVIIPFLQDTANGTIPYNHRLLRQVNRLLLQHSLLSSSSTNTASSPLIQGANVSENVVLPPPTVTTQTLLQQLTMLSKTIHAVQSYSDNVRIVHEANATNNNLRNLIGNPGDPSGSRASSGSGRFRY